MKKAFICVLLSALLVLSGCSAAEHKGTEETIKEDSNKTILVKEAESADPTASSSGSGESACADIRMNDLFSDRDRAGTYEEDGAVRIMLNGDSVSCDSGTVEIDGTTATITEEGTYILSGTLGDGMVLVDAAKEDKVQLVLNGVTMNSETCAPIYVLQADKVFLTLADGTENVLSNGGTFEPIDENEIDAAVFSKDDLTMNGSGRLSISSPAGHGVVSKDALTVVGGTYSIYSASHGLSGKDSICITGANAEITAGKDGIHAENSDEAEMGYICIESGEFTIASEGDCLSASAYMRIDDGAFDLVSGGGSINAEKETSDSWGMGGGFPQGGMMPGGSGPGGRMMSTTDIYTIESDANEDSTSIKGVKSSGDLMINGGVFTIDSADDAVHSNGKLTVNNGTFDIKTGDDGFHADDAAIINAGTISVSESYEGIEGLNVTVNGGEIRLVARDDGINAAGGTDASGMGGMRGGDPFASDPDSFIKITAGTVDIQASGDGVDSNGSLEISGGFLKICGPTVGDTAVIDYASTGTISGGILIGTGSSMMAQTVSSEGQGVLPMNVGSQTAGTKITVTDSDGNVLLSETPALDYAIALLSCPEMVKGEIYTVTVGSVSGDFAAQ